MRTTISSIRLFCCLAAMFTTAAAAGEPAASLAPLVNLLGTVDDADFQLDVLQGIHDAVQGRRGMPMPAGWPTVADKLARSDNKSVREKALLLSLIFGDRRAIAALRRRIDDDRAAADVRIAALDALVQAQVDGVPALLRLLLDDDVLRGPALRAMAAIDDDSTPAVILKRYRSFTADEKRDAVTTLTARPAFAAALLDAVEAGDVPSGDISAFSARQIVELGDERLQRRLAKVWGSVRPTASDRAALIAEYRRRLTPDVIAKADAAQGRAVFHRTCASCHKLFDAGKRIAPELTGAQRQNLDYVLSNLLDPNTVIPRAYRMSVVVTDSGRVVTGIVREENDQTLTLQTANDLVLVPKAEIEVRKQSPISMMPDGMLQKMKPDEVRGLVKYLAADTQVALPAGFETTAR